jgi:tetraacyldisaccharide 4'-kinase
MSQYMTRYAIVRALLQPLSLLYGTVMRLRTALYEYGLLDSRRLPGTVISVGNLTVGGTGKTPMVVWIAERLAAEGHRPAILTRGYRGLGRGDGNREETADEVALLRHRLDGRAQFGVGKDRYKNGLALAKDGAEWFILDDGFQHLELQRDANIVLLDGTDPFEGGGVLPAGRLREPRGGLARADIVIITRTEHAPALEALVRRFTKAPIFYAQTRLDGVLRVPSLTDDLNKWGLSRVEQCSLSDHHRYSSVEIHQLEAEAAAAGANALICTEKDVFNLPTSLAPTLPIYACRIRLALNDENAFWTAVRAAVARAQLVTQA